MRPGDTFYRVAVVPVEQGFQLSRGATADHIGHALTVWSPATLQSALAEAAATVAEAASLQHEAPHYTTFVSSWETPLMRLEEVKVLHEAAVAAYEQARPKWVQGLFHLGRAFVQAGEVVANVKTLGAGREHVARARDLVRGEVDDAEYSGVRAAVQETLSALEQGIALYHSQLELMQADINQNSHLTNLIRRRERAAAVRNSAGSVFMGMAALGLAFSAFMADKRAAEGGAAPLPSYVATAPPRETASVAAAPPVTTAPERRPAAAGPRAPKKPAAGAVSPSATAAQAPARATRDACVKACIGKCQDDSSCERGCVGGCP